MNLQFQTVLRKIKMCKSLVIIFQNITAAQFRVVRNNATLLLHKQRRKTENNNSIGRLIKNVIIKPPLQYFHLIFSCLLFTEDVWL